jgi:uncharacterized SAM-binding protein YcdF (DUF218 family)
MKPYDAIVIMPYSSGRRSDGSWGLSFESELAGRAGARMYRQNEAEKVIVLGERTYGASGLTTTQFMKERLLSLDVPDNAIETHENLNSSVEQFETLKRAHPGDETFLIISLAFHEPRVRRIATRLGIPAEYATVEDILAGADAGYASALDAWHSSEEVLRKLSSEKFVTLLDAIDGFLIRWGFSNIHLLQHFLTRILGPRPPISSGAWPALPA